jgi:hypothetical protein
VSRTVTSRRPFTRTFALLPLLAGLVMFAPTHATEVKENAKDDLPELALEKRLYVGVGAGNEAGNGIRLGGSIGNHGLETGIGVAYLGETGELRYSYGARYLYTLYEGAYVWTGAGRRGHRRGDDRGSMTSGGAGLGVSWNLGAMFRLMIDSGWRVYSDSDVADGDLQINPTLNGAIVYTW